MNQIQHRILGEDTVDTDDQAEEFEEQFVGNFSFN